MCCVSVVSEYFDQINQWTPTTTYFEYQEILKRLEALDKRLSQRDCVDPNKQVWQRQIEERLLALESLVQP